MIRIIFFTSILTTIALSACSQNGSKSDWTQTTSELYETVYVQNQNEENNIFKIDRTDITYDSKGSVISVTKYAKHSRGSMYRSSTYDSEGRELVSTWEETKNNVVEKGRSEITYDSKGRKNGFKSYKNGKLVTIGSGYQYREDSVFYYFLVSENGKFEQKDDFRTVYIETYLDSTFSLKTNSIRVLQLMMFGDTLERIVDKESWNYDVQKRITGYQSFEGTATHPTDPDYKKIHLIISKRDYLYNENSLTYFVDFYDENEVLYSTRKITENYLDEKMLKIKEYKCESVYKNNSLFEEGWVSLDIKLNMMDYPLGITNTYYDSEGRESGLKVFNENGVLIKNCRDYKYNGKTIICYEDIYNENGSIFITVKITRTYR